MFTVFPIVWAPGSPFIVPDTYFFLLLLLSTFLFKVANVDHFGLNPSLVLTDAYSDFEPPIPTRSLEVCASLAPSDLIFIKQFKIFLIQKYGHSFFSPNNLYLPTS